MKRFFCLSGLLLLAGWLPAAAPADGRAERLFRFPDINGQQIVFVYAGDIWTVPSGGGEARRLTSHQGMELFPKISPDGRWIAFSAEYSGSRQIWVMPAGGGTPRQLTWYNDVGAMPPRGGWDNVVLDWTPDSKQIMFRGNRTPYGERNGKYFLVSLEGGLETPLAIPEGGTGTLSPDGKKVAYTPIQREFRNWKRYQGGRAQDVWIYDLAASTSKQITDFTGTDQHPHWHGQKIYFVSDRDLLLNVYSYDLASGKTVQITKHTEYDVLWPSGENGQLVYENGGQLWRLDLKSGQTAAVPVTIATDAPARLPRTQPVKDFINSSDISPSGKRALFEARGDLFTVPEKEGPTVNLTRTPGVRELFPAWSPDGRQVAYYSDATGEYEIYVMPADGSGSPVQLTQNSKIWRFPLTWSPDSKKLLWGDKNQELHYLNVETKQIQIIARSKRADFNNYDWSPDSRWVVYTQPAESGQAAIWLYSLVENKAAQVTGGQYTDFSPVFSRCGKYLFFLSNRDFNLTFSSFEQDYLYQRATRVYALPLLPGLPPLLKDRNDVEEVKAAANGEAKPPAEAKPAADAKPAPAETAKPAADGPAKPVVPVVEVNFQGMEQRIVVLPLESGNYGFLAPVEGGVLVIRDRELHQFNFEDRKDTVILRNIQNCLLAANGKKVLYRQGNNYAITGLQPEQKAGEGVLNLDGLVLRIDPVQEWQQIFNDACRIFRDWFYVRNLHGVDWNRIRARYQVMLPHLAHRADLDFILHEMVAEVNVGHAYVNWGDFEQVPRIDTGLLGAELQPDPAANRYRIAKIYQGENWNEATRSPLTEQGVDVKEGDYLISIDGQDVTLAGNPYRFLENKAGQRITVRVNSKPETEGARESWIKPVRSELGLFYLDWVNSRRAEVDRLSGGRIGYLHVPDTAVAGNRELFKGFYAYRNKEALIIDERYNGGGFIPAVMIELLNRKVLHYWSVQGLELNTTPTVVHRGPKAMLINGYSSSGGDAFPYYFRKLNLGTIIGTRTWGGLVGLSGNPGFVDGGSINVPTFGFVNTDGEWDVEGIGVSPDIEVIDRPEAIAAGRDPSLEKAVEVLLEQLKTKAPTKPPTPAGPDRSKWIEKKIK